MPKPHPPPDSRRRLARRHRRRRGRPRRRPRADGALDHPPALPGGPLHRVRRRVHRPRPERRGRGDPADPASSPGAVPAGNTGDVFEDRWNFSGAYKADLNDRLSYALIFDQPLGADTRYGAGTFPASPPPLPIPLYDGSMADLKTYQISGVARLRRHPERQGLRRPARPAARRQGRGLVRRTTTRSTPTNKWGYGYLLGAAYERPDIALRVALTYYSEIPTTSTPPRRSSRRHRRRRRRTPAPTSTRRSRCSSTSRPASRRRRWSSATIRWVDWSEFAISPPVYEAGDRAAARRAAAAGRLRRRLVDLQPRRRPAAHRRARRVALDHLRAGRRRRDDLARPLRRPHHRHRGAELRLRPVELHRRPDLRRARRHHQPARRPTTTTARSGAPGCASATRSEPPLAPPRPGG